MCTSIKSCLLCCRHAVKQSNFIVIHVVILSPQCMLIDECVCVCVCLCLCLSVCEFMCV